MERKEGRSRMSGLFIGEGYETNDAMLVTNNSSNHKIH